MTESYDNLNPRTLFEIAYHTTNSVSTRVIFTKLSQDAEKGGNKAILYTNSKKFYNIEALDDHLKITVFFNEGNADKLFNEIHPKIKERKEKWESKESNLRTQLLKIFIVQRKLDECANLVMNRDIARKVYFAIGDARESAAVVPLFMETEGSSLVQLALNKWMTAAQRLPQEEKFPNDHVPGLLKNLMQIKKWVLNLISTNLDK
ncbi:MAG: putative selenocysteine system protein [Promethearchaeota archaeon]